MNTLPVRIDLGRMDLGNNHTTGHLFAELAATDRAEGLRDKLGKMDARADVLLVYLDKFGNVYRDTWDVGELYDRLK